MPINLQPLINKCITAYFHTFQHQNTHIISHHILFKTHDFVAETETETTCYSKSNIHIKYQ